MRCCWLVFSFLVCLPVVTSFEYRVPRIRRAASPLEVNVGNKENAVCSSGCLNLLRSSTEADDAYRQHFTELSALNSVVPQVLISSVDLNIFQNYCRNVYLPVRECLYACSRNFTSDVMRNLTMLETMCVDYYKEMNLYIPCMKFVYKTAVPTCESTCVSFNVTTNETSTATEQSGDISVSAEMDVDGENSSSAAMNENEVYLKPNESLLLFCWLLECVSVCDTAEVEKQCGYEAATLEDVLVDAMVRTSKADGPMEDANMWPAACDSLMLPYNGQQRMRVLSWANLAVIIFLILRNG